MKVIEESGKVCLKLNIQKTNIMAFGPITSWQIEGEIVTWVVSNSKLIKVVRGERYMEDWDHGILSHHFMANRWRNSGNSGWFIFLGSKITADGDCSHEIKRCVLLGRKVMTNLDSILKSRDYFVNKGPFSEGYGFSSGHVWMWELDYKESWVQKNWCF